MYRVEGVTWDDEKWLKYDCERAVYHAACHDLLGKLREEEEVEEEEEDG